MKRLRELSYEEWLATRYVPIAGADGADDDDTDTATQTREEKDLADKIDTLRGGLVDRIGELAGKHRSDLSEEDRAEIKRRETEIGGYVDQVTDLLKQHESDEVKKVRERIEKLEAAPAAERKGGQKTLLGPGGERVPVKQFDGDNLFQAKADYRVRSDHEAGRKISEYESQYQTPERLKAWATGDLEDVDLVLPDIQAALPFLRAAAKVVPLCRELRTSSPSVEFPVYNSGLTVDFTPEGVTKPQSDPDFDLIVARVYTIAGTTQVPNPTLEDYPVARGWISSELGLATGVREDLAVLQGTGVNQPTGILNNGAITAREAKDVNGDGKITGRDVIDATFRAIQDVRALGFTEPTDVVMNPAVWTDVVLSFEANIGYLYGPPQTEGTSDSGAPVGEPQPRLLGLPITQDAYVSTVYGATSNESPVIVGNFQDAIVLRRSPFRVDVDTSLGFRENMTWFRGEERLGFLVVRPKSFKVVTNIVPQA